MIPAISESPTNTCESKEEKRETGRERVREWEHEQEGDTEGERDKRERDCERVKCAVL